MDDEQLAAYMAKMKARDDVHPADSFRLGLIKTIARAEGYSSDGEDDGHYGKIADAVIAYLESRTTPTT